MSRLDDVVTFLNQHMGSENAGPLVRQRIDDLGHRKRAIENALSLGGREDKSNNETDRRRALRALLFMYIVEGGKPLSEVRSLKERHQHQALNTLKQEIKTRLPLFSNSAEQVHWDPANFTQVVASGPAPNHFQYIVWGMMNVNPVAGLTYAQILGDTSIAGKGMLSTSLINQDKYSTYYPYGFILRVPYQNVLSTNSSDQAFKNYRRFENGYVPTPQENNDSTMEVRRVSGLYPIKSPTTILAGTTGLRGENGYNEIAILGKMPSGSEVQAIGMFMKVDSHGGRYVRNTGPNQPFVTDAIYNLMQATNLPIITITDAGGRTH